MAKRRFNFSKGKLIGLGVLVAAVVLAVLKVEDWHQLWKISSARTTFQSWRCCSCSFFTWMGVRQSLVNDRLIRNWSWIEASKNPPSQRRSRGDRDGA